MSLEVIKPRRPQLPVRGEPLVDGSKRLGLHPVEASLGVASHFDEPRVPQDPQVLGDRGLTQLELGHERPHGYISVKA